ncbi:MAG: spore coat associated protein CotJA [Clostridia bacterium]|nr:spore coat associated protein CotJA [Clostridia bacterium]
MDRYSKYTAQCKSNGIGFTRNCDCKDAEYSVPLAMPIMPIQEFRDLYSPCEALDKGTLFKELYKPYCIRGGFKC